MDAARAHQARRAGPMHLPVMDQDNWHEPFVYPTERRFVDVPQIFRTKEQYCKVIGHNLLAEHWHVVRVAEPGRRMVAEASCNREGLLDQLKIQAAGDGASVDHFGCHLFLINNARYLVTSCDQEDHLKLTVRPDLTVTNGTRCTVQSLGYFGSSVAELRALVELNEEEAPPLVLESILNPKVNVEGEYGRASFRKQLQPLNTCQLQVIENLKFGLEKIQGPPGTGKSTTIFHIIDSRVLPHMRNASSSPLAISRKGKEQPLRRVLVTCSRNVAVESIAQKLAGLSKLENMLVIGQESNVGETAKEYLLSARLLRHPDPRLKAARAAYEKAEAACTSASSQGDKGRAEQEKHGAWKVFRDAEKRVSQEIVGERTQVFLCTIASTSRLLSLWKYLFRPDSVEMHTVIVDESGCTTESSIALILRLNPRNLILVGDHNQLPPTSLVAPKELMGTGHDRSLLERCALVSESHLLREQYRMHPDICKLVSARFYKGMLSTPGEVAHLRASQCDVPLCWVPVRVLERRPERERSCATEDEVEVVGRVARPLIAKKKTVAVAGRSGGGSSYVNLGEVEVAIRVATLLRRKHPKASVALLTLYKGQHQALQKAALDARLTDVGEERMEVEVHTVDSCQGSEFDFVVLSTVRSNKKGLIGFTKDKQRINVAISRAKRQLVVVGNPDTLAKGSKNWAAVLDACEVTDAKDYLAPGERPAMPYVAPIITPTMASRLQNIALPTPAIAPGIPKAKAALRTPIIAPGTSKAKGKAAILTPKTAHGMPESTAEFLTPDPPPGKPKATPARLRPTISPGMSKDTAPLLTPTTTPEIPKSTAARLAPDIAPLPPPNIAPGVPTAAAAPLAPNIAPLLPPHIAPRLPLLTPKATLLTPDIASGVLQAAASLPTPNIADGVQPTTAALLTPTTTSGTPEAAGFFSPDDDFSKALNDIQTPVEERA